MGTATGTTILNKAAVLLFDTNNVKWPRSELLNYLNDGQRAIVALIPEASATTSVVQLASGSRQTLPANTNLLMEVTRNMGAEGNNPGRALKRVDRAILDETNPTWYSDTAAPVCTLFMYTTRDRLAYYVYPPATTAAHVEIVTSVIPQEQAESAVIVLSDVYIPALLDYILWRAFSKEAAFANNMQKADMYLKSFSMYVSQHASDQSKASVEMGKLMVDALQTQSSLAGS
jgi:hypothetical protein